MDTVKCRLWILCQALLDGLDNQVMVGSRFKAFHYAALAVDEELGEVPHDVGLLAELLVVGLCELVKRRSLEAAAKALEGALGGKRGKEGVGGVAVHIELLEAGELGVELQRAELVDLVVGLGCLAGELVAREVQDLEALVVVGGVDALEVLVLWGEAAAGGRVHDEQDLARVGAEGHGAAVLRGDGKVVVVGGVLGCHDGSLPQASPGVVDDVSSMARRAADSGALIERNQLNTIDLVGARDDLSLRRRGVSADVELFRGFRTFSWV